MRKRALSLSLLIAGLSLSHLAHARLYHRDINIITSNYDLVDTTYIDRGRLNGVKVGDKFQVKFPDGKLATQVVVTGVFERMASVKIVDSWLLKDGQTGDFKQRPMVVAMGRSERRPAPDIRVGAKAKTVSAATAAPSAASSAPATPASPAPAAAGPAPTVPDASGLPSTSDGLPAGPGLPATPGLPPAPGAAPDAGLPRLQALRPTLVCLQPLELHPMLAYRRLLALRPMLACLQRRTPACRPLQVLRPMLACLQRQMLACRPLHPMLVCHPHPPPGRLRETQACRRSEQTPSKARRNRRAFSFIYPFA